MEFKGTKGKLTKIYDSKICIGIGVPVGKNYFEFTANSVLPDCEGWSDKKVDASLEVLEADMTLYSHAPAMLEMVNRLVSTLEDIETTLVHHNLSVAGYHLNGNEEPIMNFFNNMDMSAIEDAKALIKSATTI